MPEYYNVTTNLGDAELANAIATNTKLDITHVAFGDGNGSVPTPNKARTSLVREVHRQAVTKYERHPTNPNWIVIETNIPSNIGGFTIREMGIIANNKLISHGSHAPFEKVSDPDGVSEYRLRFTQNVTDGSVVEITLDGSLIYASQAWVEENFIKRSEIIDNLTTEDATKPVSAKQAKKLQDEKLAIADLVNNLTSGGEDKALTAEQGKILLSMFACSQNTSGYQKIPNPANPDKPLIIQWGLTPYSSPTSAVAVTLPIRFPNEIFNILLTVWDDGLGAFATTNNKTLSGFDYSVWITRQTRPNVEIFSYYIAIGC